MHADTILVFANDPRLVIYQVSSEDIIEAHTDVTVRQGSSVHQRFVDKGHCSAFYTRHGTCRSGKTCVPCCMERTHQASQFLAVAQFHTSSSVTRFAWCIHRPRESVLEHYAGPETQGSWSAPRVTG